MARVLDTTLRQDTSQTFQDARPPGFYYNGKMYFIAYPGGNAKIYEHFTDSGYSRTLGWEGSQLWLYDGKFYYWGAGSDFKLWEVDPSDWSDSDVYDTGINPVGPDAQSFMSYMDDTNGVIYGSISESGKTSLKFYKYDIGAATGSHVGTDNIVNDYFSEGRGMWSDGTYIYYAYKDDVGPQERKMAIADGSISTVSYDAPNSGAGWVGNNGFWCTGDGSSPYYFDNIHNISDGKEWDFSGESLGCPLVVIFTTDESSYPITVLLLDDVGTLHSYDLNSDESITDNGSTSGYTAASDLYNVAFGFSTFQNSAGKTIRPLVVPRGKPDETSSIVWIYDFLKADIA